MILIKRISEIIQNKIKEQKGGWLFMFFWYFRCYSIKKYLCMQRFDISWKRNNYTKLNFLILPHPLNDFEIEKLC